MKLEILAIGRLKTGPLAALRDEYIKRIRWPLSIVEIEAKNPAEEPAQILKRLKDDSFLICMDERGKTVSSADFSKKIGKLRDEARSIQFVIGGADGLSDEIRARADLLLSFGAQTWPHMLARTMLLEQIYRAQQILAGHPYHRE